MTSYQEWFDEADAAVRPLGIELVDNAGCGNCVLHSIARHYPHFRLLDDLRAHVVSSIVRHFADDAKADWRNGRERSLDSWARRLAEPHQELPPELVGRVLGELDAPHLSVRVWGVPSGDDGGGGHVGPTVLYSNAAAPADPRVRTDVELVHIEALRHTVAARRRVPRVVHNDALLFAERVAASTTTPPFYALAHTDAQLDADAKEKLRFRAAVDAFFARHPEPAAADDEPLLPTRKRSRRVTNNESCA